MFPLPRSSQDGSARRKPVRGPDAFTPLPRKEGRADSGARATPVIEALEGRRMLIGSFLSGSSLIVYGDGDAETFTTAYESSGTVIRVSIVGEYAQTYMVSAVSSVTIRAYGGNDQVFLNNNTNDPLGYLVYAGDGNDTIEGDEDNESIFGEAGADSILGYSGNDTLHGDDGNDTVVGGEGNDSLNLGAGVDHFDVYDNLGNDYVDGGPDADVNDGSDPGDTLTAI